MKNRLFTLLLIAQFAMTSQAQQTKKTLDNFTSIELSGVQDIYLQQGTENTISVDSTNDAMQSIKPIVNSNTLRLEYDRKKPIPKNNCLDLIICLFFDCFLKILCLYYNYEYKYKYKFKN